MDVIGELESVGMNTLLPRIFYCWAPAEERIPLAITSLPYKKNFAFKLFFAFFIVMVFEMGPVC